MEQNVVLEMRDISKMCIRDRPHMMRGVAGSAHRRLIPLALLGGGLFAVIADLLSRVLIAPEELPVGVISAFFGAPFFLYLIRKGSREKM